MLALQSYVTNNPEVVLVPTKSYRILENISSNNARTAELYKISDYHSSKDFRFLKQMRLHGLSTWSNLVPEEARLNAFNIIKPFRNMLIRSYDPNEDEFTGIDQEDLNIVRMPRIGRGKHNIHFDPQFSDQHKALEELAHASHFAELLTSYMGSPCSIRESGITITRPYDNNVATSNTKKPTTVYGKGHNAESKDRSKIGGDAEDEDVAPGEGMEWHSDGPRGEATILMALEDVSYEQGCLRAVPGSHRIYIDGVGHTEVGSYSHSNTSSLTLRCILAST